MLHSQTASNRLAPGSRGARRGPSRKRGPTRGEHFKIKLPGILVARLSGLAPTPMNLMEHDPKADD